MSVIRRQLFFLFVIACAASLAAEGRLVPWLIVDASLSAAFMPMFQWLGFVMVWRMRVGDGAPSARDTDGFLDGNVAWLWWWTAIAIDVSLAPPRSMGPSVLIAFLAAIALFGWTFLRDVRWLRGGYGRSERDAVLDIAGMRLVTWGFGVMWFFGIAIWFGEVPKVFAWWHS